MHQYPVVRQYMTAAPYTVSGKRSLAAARVLMDAHHIRHLPVLDGGRVIGLVSERDLLMAESLPGVNPTNVLVEEAMTDAVYATGPDCPIGEVVDVMIERKLGSAVVIEDDRVVGVFTTVDALRALQGLLARP